MKRFLCLLVVSLCIYLSCAAQEVKRPTSSGTKDAWTKYATYLEAVVAAKDKELAAAKLDTSRLADILFHILEIEKLVAVQPVPVPPPVVISPPTLPPVPPAPTTPPAIVAPVITVQPVNASGPTLGTVFFEVTATGTNLAYQWVRWDGATSPSWNEARLTLSGISSNDVGAYRVTVTNGAGSVTSSPATLTITDTPPTPTDPPVTTNPSDWKAGVPLTLFARYDGGVPAPAVQWSKNGAPILGATNAEFFFDSPTANDSGEYAAVLTNSAGSASGSDKLNVIP